MRLALMREVLAAWGRLEILGQLSGGNRNTVVEVRLDPTQPGATLPGAARPGAQESGPQRLVARRSGRPAASLDWEVALLDHLARNGLRVPQVVPALDGRRHVDGVLVQTWLDGSPPGPADWPAVAALLRRVHELTGGWPQRPGFASTRELLETDRGGDVDLSVLPADAVADCRRAWAALAGWPEAVIHGDPGAGNIRVTETGPGLLDWDEARVDYTALDLAELPGSAELLSSAEVPDSEEFAPARLAAAQAAVTAWEAASGWSVEPDYARRRLALLRSAAG